MIPEVSIIIPAYNTEAYIARAIASALGQTLKAIEVIVVDDASTDATREVIEGFCDPRLQILYNPQNRGVSASRNRAIAQARGKWIALLDSDDWFAPERLEKLLAIAEAQQADLVGDDLYFIRDREDVPWSTLLTESGEEISAIALVDPVYFVKTGIYGQAGLHLGLSKPLFRRNFLVEHRICYDETLQVVEDFHLLLQCLVEGAKFYFVPQPYYYYCSRSGSLVKQSKLRHIEQFSRTIRHFLERESIQINLELAEALFKSLIVLERNKNYYQVVEPIKNKKFLIAVKEILNNPFFVFYSLGRIKPFLWRRFRYYVLGDRFVHEMMYQKLNRKISKQNP
jgi:succinoglycan biosynthesis protein ExoO